MQEIFALFFKKKNKQEKNYPIKYFILAITFGALITGSAFLIRYIEPYTYFSSLISLTKLGIIATIIVLIITLFKNRFFCTNICPVGALLGLISKISLNKIHIDKLSCVNCSKCSSICPSGCIDYKNGKINNETCIKCLKCLDVCPKGAIKYDTQKNNETKFSPKRRGLIILGAVSAVFLATFLRF